MLVDPLPRRGNDGCWFHPHPARHRPGTQQHPNLDRAGEAFFCVTYLVVAVKYRRPAGLEKGGVCAFVVVVEE